MRCVASDARLAALPRGRFRPAPPLRPARAVSAPRAGLPYLHFHLGLPALREPGSGDHAMAWRSHGSDNASLVDALKRNSVIKDPRVESAFRAVDRGRYVQPAYKAEAYVDSPLPIGHGQTISAPHMHAACCEQLREHLKPGARVLDVGSGSGYLTAVLAQLVRPGGVVAGVEVVPPLAERSVAALDADPSVKAARADDVTVSVRVADAHWGAAEHAPYDAIHVGAAAEAVPAALVEQLARGGRMIIPVGPHGWTQVLKCIDKDGEGRVSERNLMGVQYVPLIDTGKPPPPQHGAHAGEMSQA